MIHKITYHIFLKKNIIIFFFLLFVSNNLLSQEIDFFSDLLFTSEPQPTNIWYSSVSLYDLAGDYIDSDIKESINEINITTKFYVPKKYYYRISLKNTDVNFKTFDINQKSIYLRTQQYFTPSDKWGDIAMNIDIYYGRLNSKLANIESNFNIISSGLYWLSKNKKSTIEVDFTLSNYQDSNKVSQLQAQIGHSFLENKLWVNLKYFFISPDFNYELEGVSDTSSAEIGLSYKINADNCTLAFSSALLGERVFAVDTNRESIYNFPDVQTVSYVIGLQHCFVENIESSLSYGYDVFEARYLNNTYKRNQIIFSLRFHF